MDSHPDLRHSRGEDIGATFQRDPPDISAVGVSRDLAEPLKVEPGAHALSIRRQYLFSSNEMAEVSVSVHPADSFSYSMRLTRQQPDAG